MTPPSVFAGLYYVPHGRRQPGAAGDAQLGAEAALVSRSSRVSRSEPVSGRRRGTKKSRAWRRVALEASLSPPFTRSDAVEQVPTSLRSLHIQQVGHLQGNRQASAMAATLQRHSSPLGLEDSPSPLLRAPAGSIFRAEMPAEATDIATVNAAAAPLALMDQGPAANAAAALFAIGAALVGMGAASLGALAAGDRARILERRATHARIHVETGALNGKIGWVPLASVTTTAAPTSQRDPTAGPENAYTQLQTELARVPPSRGEILFIIQTRLTMAQHRQLLAAANPEWALLMGMAAITPNDIIHILSLTGARLRRKVTDYLTKGGNTVGEMRLAFSTATDAERLEVANDDALIGRIRPILGTVHPEIVLGTVLSQVYPGDGKLATLTTTNPELAAWLQVHIPRRARATTNLITAALARAQGLQDALLAITTLGAAPARATVMAAVQAAPRGAALADAERAALDQIEEHAYTEGSYTSPQLNSMFVTRWGRPFRGANPSKTFLHRIWSAIERLPLEHVLLNNVLSYLDRNTDPTALGSFSDYLSSANFGQLVSNPPNPETLHAVANHTGTLIAVLEPTLDLLGAGHALAVQQAGGTTKNVKVKSIDVATRRVRLNKSVTVAAGGELRPPEANPFAGGAAMLIRAPSVFFANAAGTPNTAAVLGIIQPGNIFSQMGTATVGPTTYIGGGIHAGPLAGTLGWIVATGAAALGGTMEQSKFEWTARHEMGHALDLQLNGFSRFSGPSAASWRKYAGVNDWAADLINVAGIANPDTVVTYNTVNASFRVAATVYSQAVQSKTTAGANPLKALRWLQGWLAAVGTQNVFDVVTQFNANPIYYTVANLGLPGLNNRIFGAHYGEYFSANTKARTESLAVGVPPYAYTCTYEFFSDHYAAYTGPGTGGETYARAVPEWAKNFFDRMIGVANAGPRVGMDRRRMGA